MWISSLRSLRQPDLLIQMCDEEETLEGEVFYHPSFQI